MPAPGSIISTRPLVFPRQSRSITSGIVLDGDSLISDAADESILKKLL